MTNNPIKIEYENFCDVFKPKKNHLDDSAGFDSNLFAKNGEELKYVQSQAQEHIWTILDCDGSLIISSGWHMVNCFGYVVTEKAIPDSFDFEVPDETDDIIITPQNILGVAADIMPGMDDGEAQELLNEMREEILSDVDHTITYRLKEIKSETQLV